MRPDFLSPLYLRSSAPLSQADGSTCSPNTVNLINPNRTAMLIDQFRFSGPNSQGSMQESDVCQYILVDLKLGAIPLTNKLIPIGAVAPTYLKYPSYPGSSGGVLPDTQLTWHLPRPLYVPPNVQLSVKFSRAPFAAINHTGTPLIPTSAFDMTLGVAGRSMPAGWPIPQKIIVPWVNATSVYDAVTDWESKDSDLGNPHQEPLRITRFVGFNGTTMTRVSPDGNSYAGLYGNIAPDFNVRMTLSSGKMLVRDPTPFFHLFPGDRPFFNCDGLLQQNEFVRAMISMTPVENIEQTDLRFTTIGMIGYREIQTPQGAEP